MKPSHLCLALLPLLGFSWLAWLPFAVDRRVSVQLPRRPTEIDRRQLAPPTDPRRPRGWMVEGLEGKYFVLRSLTRPRLGRGDTLRRRALYDSLAAVALRSVQKGHLLNTTFFSTNGGTGCEIQYRGTSRYTHRRVVSVVRLLAVDSCCYSFSFLPAGPEDSVGVTGAAYRRRFFNSIQVKP
jgi:hypothetical protein